MTKLPKAHLEMAFLPDDGFLRCDAALAPLDRRLGRPAGQAPLSAAQRPDCSSVHIYGGSAADWSPPAGSWLAAHLSRVVRWAEHQAEQQPTSVGSPRPTRTCS